MARSWSGQVHHYHSEKKRTISHAQGHLAREKEMKRTADAMLASSSSSAASSAASPPPSASSPASTTTTTTTTASSSTGNGNDPTDASPSPPVVSMQDAANNGAAAAAGPVVDDLEAKRRKDVLKDMEKIEKEFTDLKEKLFANKIMDLQDECKAIMEGTRR